MSDDTSTTPREIEQALLPILRGLIQEETQRVVTTVLKAESHSGPIPSASHLAQYEGVVEGAAKMIMDEYRANSAHVREMESLAITSQKDDNDRNRRVAERLVWASLFSVIGLALLHHDNVAIVLAASTVGAIVTGFLAGRKPPKREG